MLSSTPSEASAVARPRGGALGRVGPFEVLRELVRGPGAVLAEGRDGEGERKLLLLVRWRAAVSDDEQAERQREERAVAQRTAEVVSAGYAWVSAHGGADLESGERVLFWALVPSEAPLVLDLLEAAPLSAPVVARVGLSLARRLIDAHARRRIDPLLAEHFVRCDAQGEAELLALPVALPPSWLTSSVPSMRLAPEEAGGALGAGGDLWRLGTLLAHLAARLAAPSAALAAVIDELTAVDPRARVATAELAAARLAPLAERTGLEADGLGSGDLLQLGEERGRSTEIIEGRRPASPAFEASDAPHPRPGGKGAAVEAVTIRTAAYAEPPMLHDPEAVTRQAEPQTPVPAMERPAALQSAASEAVTGEATPRALEADRARPVLIDRTERIEAPDRAPDTLRARPPAAGPSISGDLAASDTVVEAARQPSGVDPAEGSASGATARIRPAAPGEPEVLEPEPSAGEDPPSPGGPRPGGPAKPSVDPIAAAWAQPVLPAGESPWSEVVHPRGTHTRDRGAFSGFDDDLPVAARGERRAQPIVAEPPSARAARGSFEEVSTGEIEAELAEALRGVDKRKLISAILVTLVICGLFALLSRTGREPSGKEAMVATAENEVTLESDPSGATVVAEADGAVLGKTPLTFLVAPGSGAQVFLVSPGREPLRLGLPDRGGLTAKLVPMARTECVVEIAGVEGVEVEGVEADIGPYADRRIPGAAVVRAKPGQRLRGARLVRCPDLGGTRSLPLGLERRGAGTLVRVVAPEGATAYLDGDPLGKVPAQGRTTAAFAAIRVDDPSGAVVERLVPAPSEIVVRMPAARARPAAKLLAGDEADGPKSEGSGTEREPRTAAREAAPQKQTKAERVIRARGLLRQGSKLLASGQIPQARESLVECVALDANAAECHKMLGMLYRRARSTFKAREHFTRYLELAPEASDAAKIRELIEP